MTCCASIVRVTLLASCCTALATLSQIVLLMPDSAHVETEQHRLTRSLHGLNYLKMHEQSSISPCKVLLLMRHNTSLVKNIPEKILLLPDKRPSFVFCIQQHQKAISYMDAAATFGFTVLQDT